MHLKVYIYMLPLYVIPNIYYLKHNNKLAYPGGQGTFFEH